MRRRRSRPERESRLGHCSLREPDLDGGRLGHGSLKEPDLDAEPDLDEGIRRTAK